MPFPVNLLQTWAHCDAVLTALNLELRVFNVRDSVLDLRSEQATGRASNTATERQTLTDTIGRLTPLVAGLAPGTPERHTNERLLKAATRRLEDLNVVPPTGTAAAVTAFLQAVDVRQVEVQVPELTTAIAEVTAHRATLSA
ncbi:hypothetical protein [Hymenobacter terrenus]|uniref:hypothetical protein n=1 Tax=Hymenobacter terrenus TaxID=1629124 RepID=UPI00061A0A5B|nr:hypothetical protein [Hymenobacter terrenus]